MDRNSIESVHVEGLNLANGEHFLSLIEEAKELLDKGATPEGRREYMHKLKEAMLDEKSASLASKYADLINEVMDPDTDSALNSDALKRLGELVADKMNIEEFYNSDDPKKQSALKVIGALKGLSGLTDLLKHNLDPNDITKLDQERIRKVGLKMLNEFDLADDAMDLAKEGGEFVVAGTKVYSILNTQPLNPFALVHAGQALLKEGADVLNEFNEATPAIHALVVDVQDGLSAIYEHASNQYSEYSEIVQESYGDFQKIGFEFQKEMRENWEEANDGDGDRDGMISYGLSTIQSAWKASAKGMAEAGETISEIFWTGHEDGDEKVSDTPVVVIPVEMPSNELPADELPAESPVVEKPSIDWNEELPTGESSDDNQATKPLEVIHGFEGVTREESYPELDLNDLMDKEDNSLKADEVELPADLI